MLTQLAFTPAGLECVRVEQQESCTAVAGQVRGIWHHLKAKQQHTVFIYSSLLQSTLQSFLNCPEHLRQIGVTCFAQYKV